MSRGLKISRQIHVYHNYKINRKLVHEELDRIVAKTILISLQIKKIFFK